MENISIAKILKPQGVKGELKLELYIKDEDFFNSLTNVMINGVTYPIISCDIRFGYGYMVLKGVNDRNMAETLRNKVLSVPKEQGPQLDNNEYFIEDMIGLNVVDEKGFLYGNVVQIEQYGAADVYVVSGRKGNFSFPFIENVVTNVDIDNKTIYVDSKTLDEVRV